MIRIERWMRLNNLKINHNKPVFIIFGRLANNYLSEDTAKSKPRKSLVLFADNTNHSVMALTESQLLCLMKEDMIRIERWMRLNNLKINHNKPVFIIFGRLANNYLSEDTAKSNYLYYFWEIGKHYLWLKEFDIGNRSYHEEQL
ncbi:hypothetical protein QYM36_017545 [Artemia franciscana]|uniref:Uncharacterized protein n=1 Tax=Artemia franciscana TaxID=6661 RepID=A0AA88HBW3_ARTSF|nr:hypothetical protein QYM36_017545 [Artemia franciscana]